MLLEGGLDWRPMGYSPADMEYPEDPRTPRRETLRLRFGVPPMLLGLPGDNTYSNYQEANRAFYRHHGAAAGAQDRARRWPAGWRRPRTTMRLSLDPRPRCEMPGAVGPEREARWKRVTEADFLDADEKRALLGFPPRSPAAPVAEEG